MEQKKLHEGMEVAVARETSRYDRRGPGHAKIVELGVVTSKATAFSPAIKGGVRIEWVEAPPWGGRGSSPPHLREGGQLVVRAQRIIRPWAEQAEINAEAAKQEAEQAAREKLAADREAALQARARVTLGESFNLVLERDRYDDGELTGVVSMRTEDFERLLGIASAAEAGEVS